MAGAWATMSRNNQSKRDNVESVRIVPTKAQKRFAISGTSIGLLIGLIGTIAGILSIPILQPYLAPTSLSPSDVRSPEAPGRDQRPAPPPTAAPGLSPTKAPFPVPTDQSQPGWSGGEPQPSAVPTPSPSSSIELTASRGAPLTASITQPTFRDDRSFGFVLTLRSSATDIAVKTFGRGGSAYGWTAVLSDTGEGCYGSEDRIARDIPHVREDLGNPDRRPAVPITAGGSLRTSVSFWCPRGVNPNAPVAVQIRIYVVDAAGDATPYDFAMTHEAQLRTGPVRR